MEQQYLLLVKQEEDQTVTISDVKEYVEDGDTVYTYRTVKEVAITELDPSIQDELKNSNYVRQYQS